MQGQDHVSPPPSATSDLNDLLRRRVVEIVSSTANGCLTELGYHPGIQQALKKSDATIAKLKSDNSKLHIDNRTLSAHLALQNDRISFHESSADDQWRRTVDLQEKNHLLQLQYAGLMKTYEASVAGLPTEQSYVKLLSDLEHLQAQHRQTVSENTTLRFEVQRLTDQCIKRGLFTSAHATIREPENPPSEASVDGDQQASPIRRTSAGVIRQSFIDFSALGPSNQGMSRTLPAIHRPGPSRTLTIDTARSIAHRNATSITSAPPDRRSSFQDYFRRPLSASAGANTKSRCSPTSPVMIDLTEDDPGPTRKKVKLTDAPSDSTPAIFEAHNTQPLSVSASRPSPHGDDSVAGRSPSTQLIPSVSLPPPLSVLDTSSTQAPPTPTNGDKKEDVDYEQCVDAIIEEQDGEAKRICKLCSMRHAVGLIKELPKPWVGATLDELISHCQDEHPAAWKQLLDSDEEEDDDEEIAETT